MKLPPLTRLTPRRIGRSLQVRGVRRLRGLTRRALVRYAAKPP
jgi:hypothetical protein